MNYFNPPNFSFYNILTMIVFVPYPLIYKIFANRSKKGKKRLVSCGVYYHTKNKNLGNVENNDGAKIDGG